MMAHPVRPWYLCRLIASFSAPVFIAMARLNANARSGARRRVGWSPEVHHQLGAAVVCGVDALGCGEGVDHLGDVLDLDGSPGVDVGAGPVLMLGEALDQEYLFAVFERDAGLHFGAGGAGGFDDDGALGDAGHGDVAAGEGVGRGWAVGPELGYHGAVGGDLVGEGPVFGGVVAVDAGADDGDGAAAGVQGGGVGGGVDPAGESGYDGDAGGGE